MCVSVRTNYRSYNPQSNGMDELEMGGQCLSHIQSDESLIIEFELEFGVDGHSRRIWQDCAQVGLDWRRISNSLDKFEII